MSVRVRERGAWRYLDSVSSRRWVDIRADTRRRTSRQCCYRRTDNRRYWQHIHPHLTHIHTHTDHAVISCTETSVRFVGHRRSLYSMSVCPSVRLSVCLSARLLHCKVLRQFHWNLLLSLSSLYQSEELTNLRWWSSRGHGFQVTFPRLWHFSQTGRFSWRDWRRLTAMNLLHFGSHPADIRTGNPDSKFGSGGGYTRRRR